MAYTLSSYEKAAISGTQYPYRVAVLVEAETLAGTSTWVDLNKEAAYNGGPDDPAVRLLLQNPSVTLESEVRPGRFSTSVTPLKLRNWGPYDHNGSIEMGRIFNVDPYSLRFKDVNGNDCRIAEWRNQNCKITIYYHTPGSGTWSSTDLGTFRIEDVTTSGPEATMRLVGLERLFMDAKAEDLKEGDSWFTNIQLPDLLERIAEVGSDGDVSLASKPASLKLTATEGRYFSNVGILPRKDNDDERNVTRNFVCRYQWYANGFHWFVGYDQILNRAAALRWNEATEAWKYVTISGTDFLAGGYEGVFGHYDSTNNKLYMCAIINRTGQNVSGYSHNPVNHDMLIYSFTDAHTNLTQGTIYGSSSEANASPCYLPMQLAQYPEASTVYYWGQAYATDKNNLASPFPCMLQSPGFSYGDSGNDESWLLERYNSGPTDQEPKRADSMTGGTQSGGFSSTGDDRPHRMNVQDGYYQAATRYGYNTEPKGWAINSYASGSFHDAFRYDSTRSKFYWVSWYAGAIFSPCYWKLNYFDISTQTFGSHYINFGTGAGIADSLEKYTITAFDLFSETTSAGVCYIATVDNTSALGDPTAVHLYRFTLPASGEMNTPTDLITDFDSKQYGVSQGALYCPQIYSIRHNPNRETVTQRGTPICGGVVNRYAVSGMCYGMWYYKDSNYNGIFKNKDYSTFATRQFPVSTMPFEFSSTAWRADDLDYPWWFIQDQSTGRIYRYQFDYPAKNVELLAAGDSVDRENTWCSSNIYCDGYDAYGVHASGPPAGTQVPVLKYTAWLNYAPTQQPQLGLGTPAGRIMFWQYSDEISDLVEVADFGDGSAWDALEMCRQLAGDYRMGINKSGALALAARTGSPNLYIAERDEMATGFLSPTSRRIPCESITSHVDYKAFANKYTLPIYEPGRDEPKIELILGPNSTADKSASITANQVSNAAQRIVLKCVNNGSALASGHDGTLSPLLFSWRLANASVTTSLKYPAQTNTNVIDVYGLYSGADSIARIGDSKVYVGDEVQLEGGDVRIIETINTSTGRITLDGDIGGAADYKRGSVVTITPKNSRRVGDSADGVCVLTQDSVQFSEFRSGALGAAVSVDDSSRVSVGMIVCVSGAYLTVTAITDSNTIYLKADQIGGSRAQFATTDTIPSGTPLAAFIWIESGSIAYPISDTGVTLMVSPNSTGGVGGGLFSPGDRIVIDCNGLQMREIEHSTTRSVDTESVAKYGPHEWQNRVENRLLTEMRGKIYLQAVDDLTAPPRVVKITGMPLMPGMDVGTPVNVISKREFPDYPDSGTNQQDYNIDCEVIGVTWNTESGTMNLKCRSIEDLRRDGDPASVASYDRVTGRPRKARRRIRR